MHLAILRADPQLGGPAAPLAGAAGPELPEAAHLWPAGAPTAAEPAAGPPAAASAAVPRAPRLSNLPAQLTSFVGRDDELRRLGKLLGESRLVTLTGPGGAGKTRLSIETSARLADELPDGVWFVPLAPVRDAPDVPQAVLTAVGLQETGLLADPVEAARLAAQQPLDRLADALASRRLLLVLDNCEHLVGAGLGDHVIAADPGLSLGWLQQGRQYPDDGGLGCPVRAEQGQYPAAVSGDIDARQRLGGAEALRQPFGLDHMRHVSLAFCLGHPMRSAWRPALTRLRQRADIPRRRLTAG